MKEVKKAIKVLVKALKSDEGYRESWKANIAMAFMDNWTWYARKKNKKVMNKIDRHTIANNAAEYFIKLLSSK